MLEHLIKHLKNNHPFYVIGFQITIFMHQSRRAVSQDSIASSSHDDWDTERGRAWRRMSTSGGASSSGTHPISTQTPIDCLVLLFTGCSLALLSQYMARLGVSIPRAQLTTWTRFTCKFLCSTLIESNIWRSGRGAGKGNDQRDSNGGHHTPDHGLNRESHVTIIAMGILDVLGFSLSSFGFQLLGSSRSTVISAALSQVLTATTRRLILKRKLSIQQIVGVAVVTLGLVVRGAGPSAFSTIMKFESVEMGAEIHNHSSMMLGFVFLFFSTLCYALVGIGFEWIMMKSSNTQGRNSFIQRQMSLVGTVATSAYIALFVLPHRKELIFDQIKSVSTAFVIFLYLMIGGIFTGHSFIQGYCIGSRGSVAVNTVNALRSVAVTLLNALLFCHEPCFFLTAGSAISRANRECLSLASILGSLLVCLGVVVFSTARPLGPKDKRVHTEKQD